MTGQKCDGTTAAPLIAVLVTISCGWIQPAHAGPEVAGCAQIKTAAQLQAMKNNLAGVYCLMKDIDVASIANFEPIGALTPFTGRLYGNGYAVRNLTINNATHQFAGLFGQVEFGVIQDVGLVNVNVISTMDGRVGALAGAFTSGKLQRVHVTGRVKCAVGAANCISGGLLGLTNASNIHDVWSSAAVIGGYASGGLVGAFAGDTNIRNSHSTGDVTCSGSGCVAAGGFTAQISNSDQVRDSYATGNVKCLSTNCIVGGFTGYFLSGGLIADSYATGAVSGSDGRIGGLIGQMAGTATGVLAAGPVTGGAGAFIGGLIGAVTGSPSVTNAYWDSGTTGQMMSAGGLGTPRTTAQLRSALPSGLPPGAWGITKNLSYPFLNTEGFSSNLATLVLANNIYTALPIKQSDKSQYIGNPAHTENASLATVYSMVARAIGQTLNVTQLDNVKINKYFWNDATQATKFAGPITSHATLGPMTAIGAGAKLNGSNVIGAFDARNWVVLRGTYQKPNGQTATHHMLGTLYTKKGAAASMVIANDPFTGQQVAIDAATKKVVLPADFPLTGFRVNGYATISNIH